MKTLILLLITASSLVAEIKYQEPVIPADQGKLYNEIVELRKTSPKEAMAKFSTLPQDYSPAFDFLKAVIMIDQGLKNRAKIHLKTALKKLPSFYQARITLAQLLLQELNHKEALPELIEIVKLGRADGKIWKFISVCHYELKNFEAAKTALNQTKIFLANDAELDKALLNIYIQQEDFLNAEKLAGKLLDKYPTEQTYWSIYIQSLVNNDKHKKALNYLQLYVNEFKATDDDLKKLADLYFNEKIYLKAASIYLKVEGKLSGKALIQAARSYVYIQEYQRVIGILKSLDSLTPSEKSEFYLLKGQAFAKLGDTNRALQSFLNASKFDTQNSYTHFYTAELYESNEEYSKALDFYDRAAKNNRFFISAKLRKARIYINLNQNDKALQEVEEVREVDQSQSTVNFYNYLKNLQK